MNIITQKYEILCYGKSAYTKCFSIKFDTASFPKDVYGHYDAVEEYLIDTNQNPFESIPDFIIIAMQ